MLLSIVTVTKNNLSGLKKTVESVAKQEGIDCEYVVVDGGSSDGSKDFLINSGAVVSRWISEPDSGIYDAMNKGIRLARGEWILFLNGGDLLSSNDALAVFARDHLDYADFSIVYTDSYEEMADGEVRLKRARSHRLLSLGMFTHHQAMLFRRERIMAGYDLRYKIAGDYALVAALISSGAKVAKLTANAICVFQSGGLSQRQVLQGRAELLRVQRDILGYGWVRRAAIGFALMSVYNLRTSAPMIYKWLKFRGRGSL